MNPHGQYRQEEDVHPLEEVLCEEVRCVIQRTVQEGRDEDVDYAQWQGTGPHGPGSG